jgi:hypothetical protein
MTEVTDWFDELDQREWDRVVPIIERLVALGPAARMREKGNDDGQLLPMGRHQEAQGDP